MKGLYLILILLMVGCNQPNLNNSTTDIIYTTQGLRVSIYTMYGCQYIGKLNGTDSDWATHKGDCNNKIHKYDRQDTLN